MGGNAGNESVVDRVRRLEEGQGGQAEQAVLAVKMCISVSRV